MDTRKLITRIALGVAIAALVFSFITLIRAIILRQSVLFAAVQVIGTLIITAICAIMLYVLRREGEEEDEGTQADVFDDADQAQSASTEQEEAPQAEPLSAYEAPSDTAFEDKYHFDHFE